MHPKSSLKESYTRLAHWKRECRERLRSNLQSVFSSCNKNILFILKRRLLNQFYNDIMLYHLETGLSNNLVGFCGTLTFIYFNYDYCCLYCSINFLFSHFKYWYIYFSSKYSFIMTSFSSLSDCKDLKSSISSFFISVNREDYPKLS